MTKLLYNLLKLSVRQFIRKAMGVNEIFNAAISEHSNKLCQRNPYICFHHPLKTLIFERLIFVDFVLVAKWMIQLV